MSEVGDIGESLAPHRTAIWFDSREPWQNFSRVWQTLRHLSTEIAWDSFGIPYPPILAIHWGIIVNHEFAISATGHEMVECVMVGAPDKSTKKRVETVLQHTQIDGLLHVDLEPPSPDDPDFSLMLYGLLTHRTFIKMTSNEEMGLEVPRKYDRPMGLEVVYPLDYDELMLLTVPLDSPATDILLRVICRNLHRWISEPKLGSSTDVTKLLEHAYELRHIGAVRAAGITAATALELLLVQWGNLQEEGLRVKRTTLGRLIEKVKKSGKLPADTISQLERFNELRINCAHALAKDTMNDDELEGEVDKFLEWLTEKVNI